MEEAYTDSAMYAGYIEPIIYGVYDFAEQGKTMHTHHPHNAFLMYWLAVGIIGALLFFSGFAARKGMQLQVNVAVPKPMRRH